MLATARMLAGGMEDDEAIARVCLEFVRDWIRHSGDHRDGVVTCRASEVLREGTSWCYAKSHLPVALLRANSIPAGLAYQRLGCSEYRPGIFCLHGLNWIYLKRYGWYWVDPRGNKPWVSTPNLTLPWSVWPLCPRGRSTTWRATIPIRCRRCWRR